MGKLKWTEGEKRKKVRKRIRRKEKRMEKRMEKSQRKRITMRWRRKIKINLVKINVRRQSNRERQKKPQKRPRNLLRSRQERKRGKIKMRELTNFQGERGTSRAMTRGIIRRGRTSPRMGRPGARCQVSPP